MLSTKALMRFLYRKLRRTRDTRDTETQRPIVSQGGSTKALTHTVKTICLIEPTSFIYSYGKNNLIFLYSCIFFPIL